MTNSKIQHYGPFVARVLFALLFLISALGMLTNIGGTIGYFSSFGIPLAGLVLIIVLIAKIGGALMVATGIHAREGAWILIAFTVLTILIAHTTADQLIQALKNLAIIGGLLMIVVHGEGPISLAKKCPCPVCKASGGTHKEPEVSAAGGVCNCGNCSACKASRKHSHENKND